MKGCENPWEKAVDAIGSLEGKAAMIIGWCKESER
jgi:hypothetical protein